MSENLTISTISKTSSEQSTSSEKNEAHPVDGYSLTGSQFTVDIGLWGTYGNLIPEKFSDKLVELLKNSSSQSSRKALSSDLKLYLKWSSKHDIETPLPASPENIAEWIADLESNRSVPSISRYISSISRVHDKAGWPNPTKSELVSMAMKGLRRTTETDSSQRKAHALRGEDLLRILDSLPQREWPGRRNRAILAIGWSCGLRSSEICRLNIGDISEIPEGLVVFISRSKTDQEGKGYKLGIPNSPLCDIAKDWLQAVKRLYGDENGPLFPRLGYAQKDRWFPPVGVRKRLTTRGLQKIITKLLHKNGITGSVHSLRRGIITEASAAGVPELVIQRHSRHRSIEVLRGYVDDGNIMTSNPLLLVFARLFGS